MVETPPSGVTQDAPDTNTHLATPRAQPLAPKTIDMNILTSFFQFFQQKNQDQNIQNQLPLQQSFAHKASLQQLQTEKANNREVPKIQTNKTPIRARSYKSTFNHTTKGGFDSFKNVFVLKKEIELHFPNVNIRVAYINKEDQLVIKASTASDHDLIQGTWPDKAFKTGIKLLDKPTKLFVALINVGLEFDVNDAENKSEMLKKYKFSELTRIKNRKLNQPTRTVQAICNDHDAYEKILSEGKVYLGFTSVKARPWNFRQSTNQCFKCCGLGHTQKNCSSKSPKCLRCAKEHSYKDCDLDPTTSAYKCANCQGDHSADSKDCPILSEHTNKLTKPEPNTAKDQVPIGFTRIPSSAPNSNVQSSSLHRDFHKTTTTNPQHYSQHSSVNSHQDVSLCGVDQQITGLLLFFTEFISDFHNIISAIEEKDNSAYLDMIERYLGPHQRTAVNHYLNKTQLMNLNDQSLESTDINHV